MRDRAQNFLILPKPLGVARHGSKGSFVAVKPGLCLDFSHPKSKVLPRLRPRRPHSTTAKVALRHSTGRQSWSLRCRWDFPAISPQPGASFSWAAAFAVPTILALLAGESFSPDLENHGGNSISKRIHQFRNAQESFPIPTLRRVSAPARDLATVLLRNRRGFRFGRSIGTRVRPGIIHAAL
jgi:hypothetical protein